MASQNISNLTTFRGDNLPYLRNISKAGFAGLRSIFAAIVALVGAIACAAPPAADPMQVAEQVAEAHVANEVALAPVSAAIAARAAELNPLMAAVGADALEAAINQEIEWRYKPATAIGEDRFAIRAYADCRFFVANPQGGIADIVVALPYDIIVDTRDSSVLSMDVVHGGGVVSLGGDYEFEDDDQ